MATIVREEERAYPAHYAQRRILNWAAIVGGVFAALGLQLLLVYLGSAIGATVFSPIAISSGVARFDLATLVWVGVTAIISAAFGAWVAGHWANVFRSGDALINGTVTWALWLVLTTLALTNMASWSGSMTQSAAVGNQPISQLSFNSLADPQFTRFLLSRAQNWQTEGGPAINVSADQNQGQNTGGTQNQGNQNQANQANQSNQGGGVLGGNQNQGNQQTAAPQAYNQGKVHSRGAIAKFVSNSTNMSTAEANQFVNQDQQAIAQAQDQAYRRWHATHRVELDQLQQTASATKAITWTLFGIALFSLLSSLGGSYLGWRQRNSQDEDEDIEHEGTTKTGML